MAESYLFLDERKQLIEILSNDGDILTVAKRRALLENAGLESLIPKITIEGETDQFAESLVHLLEQKGIFNAAGDPVLALLLRHLHNDTLSGQPATKEFITRLLAKITPPAARAAPLRTPNPDFVGRTDDIKSIINTIKRGRIAFLHGMGGAGKSELAVQVAQQIHADFPGAALMLELQPDNSPVSATDLLRQLILVLHPALRLPDTEAELTTMARNLLAGQKGILLLDNAAARAQFQPLEALWQGWAIMITSRVRFSIPGATLVNIGPLPPDQSVELLTTLLANYGRTEDPVLLITLAEQCHHLPLALTVAAAYLDTYPDWSLPRYLEALKAQPFKMLVAPDYDAVSQVLGLSVTHLQADDPLLAQRWQLLAIMPAPFDTDLAAALWGTLHEGERPYVASLESEDTAHTLSQLVQRSLLLYDSASEQYRLHDLLKRYATDVITSLSPTIYDEAVRRHALAMLQWGSAAQELFDEGQQVEALRRFDTLWVHLNGAWQHLATATDLTSNYFLDGVPGWMSSLLSLRLTPSLYIPYLEIALAAAQRIGDKGKIGVKLSNLGNAHHSLGDAHTAIAYHEQALAISRDIGDRHGEGNHLGNLGNTHRNLGDAHTAISYHEQALVISREIGSKRAEGQDLCNLGNAYANLGDLPLAIDYYQQALAIRRTIGDRRGEGIDHWNLALAYDGQGGRALALDHARTALALYEAIEHPEREKVRAKIAEWEQEGK